MIGIFDSGIGGLTVVKEIKKALPGCPIVYFGDTARSPWGNKSAELVRKYSSEISRFLVKEGAKDIIIACNTASTFAADHLIKEFPEINFYDVINPVVRKIGAQRKNDKNNFRVAVIGTRGTVESGIYEKKIRANFKNADIISQACPLFVPIVEEGMNDGRIAEAIAHNYLGKWKNKKIDVLILGCTHYPLLKNIIKKESGVKKLISSAEEIAQDIKNKFKDCRFDDSRDIYYFSDLTDHYKIFAQKIIGKKINIQKISF